MYRLPLLIGLLFTPSAHALYAPEAPEVTSRYVEEIFTHVEEMLDEAQGGDAGDCDRTESEREAIRDLADILFDLDAAVVQPQKDIMRSACFVHDIVALEKYLRSLIDLMLQEARTCRDEDQAYYRGAISYVWQKLASVRRYGLDPRIQDPLEGEGTEEVSIGAAPHDDDTLCPYDSSYAQHGIPSGGCLVVPNGSPDRLRNENTLWWNILSSLGLLKSPTGLSLELPLFHSALGRIWSDTALFVENRAVQRKISPLQMFLPDLAERTEIPNTGEAGCLGYPSDTTGAPVTGENMSLGTELILTDELADVFLLLQEREHPRWQEYIRVLEEQRDDDSMLGQTFFLEDLSVIDQEHRNRESFTMLAIRDPQQKMEELGNLLHSSTRDFVRQVVVLPGDEESDDGPPLRHFVRKYARFLSRMCANRGCANTLLRATELSMRDECFSEFLLDKFFRENPEARSLETCRATFVGE